MIATIVTLPGDGIGPEVIEQAKRVLSQVAVRFGHQFHFEDHPFGGISIDIHGTALTDETLERCKQADAVLLGAVGGPKWDDPSARVRPEQGLLGIRKGLQVFANLRPVRVYPALIGASPLKKEFLEDVDLIVIRELTGGLYFGQPKGRFKEGDHEWAVDTLEYYDYEIQRVVDLAFNLARKRRGKVTSVDKANVLDSSRLWRQVTIEIGKRNPDVELEHMLVDTASMRLITNPRNFDVIVTENTFGDILTDEASVLSGSMGLLPSASIGTEGPGLYEPIHGSAPDIAGKGIANPLGTILSAALMLRYSLNLEKEAQIIENAVEVVINQGFVTVDLGGKYNTIQVTDAVMDQI